MSSILGILVKNAPAILGAVASVTPEKWRGSLNKVRAGAVVAGSGIVAGLTLEEAGTQLVYASLASIGVPDAFAAPGAVVGYYLASGGLAMLATFATGWATREDPARLAEVDAR